MYLYLAQEGEGGARMGRLKTAVVAICAEVTGVLVILTESIASPAVNAARQPLWPR